MVSTTTTVYPELHHPDLYFEDGNVVLSALNGSGDRSYFRVHKSILCKHSPVFEQMFMLPPLTEEDKVVETYDGVPAVDMPDSAEDVGSFLGVLYDPTYV